MEPRRPDIPRDDIVRSFVEQLLSTGLMLANLLAGLLEEISTDAFPGEDPAEVLMDMLTGTLRPVAEAAGAGAVRQATSLLGAVADRTVSDLRVASDRHRG